ncbi:MAG: hypothetical protein H7A01_18305 [Hahellaceae bacterium]|nr:hypothetical protein [Hahellaceae bacterium]MCP5213041.1 hypothetical protein [Hahellaceae bacterium]
MATTKTRKSGGKAAAAVETSQSIEQLTAAFLKSGGEIENIPTGVSGQQSVRGPRHIKIGNK